ncbi:hypothetical protein L7F22_038004 [Adiantum nelumboides]|nr:hypothetical protein [Adiantum nelumboides]
MIEDLPATNSQAALIQNAKLVACLMRTTTIATSSRATRSSKKSLSDDKRMDINKGHSKKGSDDESEKDSQARGPFEFEKSDEEDTSTPLKRKEMEKSKKPRMETQIAYAKVQARVEERNKKLADARAAKATASTKPVLLTMEETRLAKIEKAKELQIERQRIAAEQKAQELDITSQSSQALAQEKIKEALKRTVEEAVLEPREGEPKKQQIEKDEENIENIQGDPTPPYPKSAPPASPPSPKSQAPPASPPSPKSQVPPVSPPAPKSPQQQPQSAKEVSTQSPSQALVVTKVQKEDSKIEGKDDKAQVDAPEHQEEEQGPRGVLEPHPPGPPQETMQIYLPTWEILEPRMQSSSSTRAIPIPTVIIQIDRNQEEAYEISVLFYSSVFCNWFWFRFGRLVQDFWLEAAELLISGLASLGLSLVQIQDWLVSGLVHWLVSGQDWLLVSFLVLD